MPGYDVAFLGAAAGPVLFLAGAAILYAIGRRLQRKK